MEKLEKAVPRIRFSGYRDKWSMHKLKDVAAIKGRIGFRGYTVSDLVPAGQGALTIGAKHIGPAGRLNLTDPTYLSWEKYHESPEIMVAPGDILFVQRGSLGMTALVDEVPEPATINPSMVIIRVSGADPEFIYQTLSGPIVQKEVEQISTATAVPMISQGQIGSFAIALPTLPEQQKIAAFLGAVDRKIQQLKRKQALLEQYKKGVVQQLFSQELRFKRKDGGEFPVWEEKRLGDICSTFKSGEGITADEIDIGGEYPVYGGNGLRGFTDSFTHDGYYVLIGRQGALCGNINRVRGKVYISEHAIAVQCDKSSDTEWLAQLLTYMNLNRLSESSAQPGLAVNKLVQLKVSVPSLEEQSRIAGFLMALDAKVAGVAQAVAAAQKWKKGLLQGMFV